MCTGDFARAVIAAMLLMIPIEGASLPLVPDGSFENCFDCFGCAWECTANNNLGWIINPSHPGNGWNVDAYDGTLVAWLGGFYGGVPNQNKFCETINVVGDCIAWKWMGWVPEGHVGNVMRVTLDGEVVFEKVMSYPEDHTYPEWRTSMIDNLWDWQPDAELCFEFIPTDGANMLLDYIEWWQAACTTPVGSTSFSTIKSYYR